MPYLSPPAEPVTPGAERIGILLVNSGTPEFIRNTDILPELQKLGESANFEWITNAADRLAEVERGMRRNLLRSLSLDAFAVALEK